VKFSNVLMTVLVSVLIVVVALQLADNEKADNIKSPNNTDLIYRDSEDRANHKTLVTTRSSYSERINSDDDYQITRANAVTRAVKINEPSVVSINVIKTQIVRRNQNPFDNPFFGFFDYQPYRREVQSIGSGVIYSENGYILTNSHVVEGATQIKVILNDARQFEAEITGIDTVLDIAVLKIDEDNLPVAAFGSSDDLMLGETTIAIGNPYAFLIKDSKPSVSVGVVSAVNRNFSQDQGGKIYQSMIQTDAAINPGNSGGPLLNILGEVIGINSFIFSESGGNIGLGFAIPIDRSIRIADEIIKYGRRRQIWFGFKIQDLNPMIATHLGLSDLNGVIVSVVDNNSPADKAGLKRGDIIKQINKVIVSNSNDAEVAISGISIGDEIRIHILRGNQSSVVKFTAVEPGA
jgi:serine protease Do